MTDGPTDGWTESLIGRLNSNKINKNQNKEMKNLIKENLVQFVIIQNVNSFSDI